MIEVRMLGSGDADVLRNVDRDVFDGEVREVLAGEFLADGRHHLAVAIDDGLVVGFASGVHYVHPDKPAELFVNEVGVASTHRRRGIGRAVLEALMEQGRVLGCTEAWVLTERSNPAAVGLYEAVGGEAATDEVVMFSFTLDAQSR